MSITHRADGLHLGIHLAVLAPVPDFAVPLAFLDQTAPHGSVEIRSLPSRAQQARVAAQHFVTAVAGDAAKCVVDVDDRAVSGGDHDAFAGMGEDAGGELELLFGLFALGDVMGDAQHADQLAPGIAHRRLGGFKQYAPTIFGKGQPFLVADGFADLDGLAVVFAEGVRQRLVHEVVVGLAQDVGFFGA